MLELAARHGTTPRRSRSSARRPGPLLVLALAACTALGGRDPITLREIVDLKVETLAVVATFDRIPPSANAARLEALELAFRKAEEYQRVREGEDGPTLRALGAVHRLLDDTAGLYRRLGPEGLARQHGPDFLQERLRQLGRAFDLALGVERARNPG